MNHQSVPKFATKTVKLETKKTNPLKPAANIEDTIKAEVVRKITVPEKRLQKTTTNPGNSSDIRKIVRGSVEGKQN